MWNISCFETSFHKKLKKIKKNSSDRIILEDIDESNEWLLGRMEDDSNHEIEFVFGDDDLTKVM